MQRIKDITYIIEYDSFNNYRTFNIIEEIHVILLNFLNNTGYK